MNLKSGTKAGTKGLINRYVNFKSVRAESLNIKNGTTGSNLFLSPNLRTNRLSDELNDEQKKLIASFGMPEIESYHDTEVDRDRTGTSQFVKDEPPLAQ